MKKILFVLMTLSGFALSAHAVKNKIVSPKSGDGKRVNDVWVPKPIR